jgi:hypothetical protein
LFAGLDSDDVDCKNKALNTLLMPKKEAEDPDFKEKRPLTAKMYNQYKLNLYYKDKPVRDYQTFTPAETKACLIPSTEYSQLGTILSNNLLTMDKYTFSEDRTQIVDRQNGRFLVSNPLIIGVLYEYEKYINP